MNKQLCYFVIISSLVVLSKEDATPTTETWELLNTTGAYEDKVEVVEKEEAKDEAPTTETLEFIKTTEAHQHKVEDVEKEATMDETQTNETQEFMKPIQTYEDKVEDVEKEETLDETPTTETQEFMKPTQGYEDKVEVVEKEETLDETPTVKTWEFVRTTEAYEDKVENVEKEETKDDMPTAKTWKFVRTTEALGDKVKDVEKEETMDEMPTTKTWEFVMTTETLEEKVEAVEKEKTMDVTPTAETRGFIKTTEAYEDKVEVVEEEETKDETPTAETRMLIKTTEAYEDKVEDVEKEETMDGTHQLKKNRPEICNQEREKTFKRTCYGRPKTYSFYPDTERCEEIADGECVTRLTFNSKQECLDGCVTGFYRDPSKILDICNVSREERSRGLCMNDWSVWAFYPDINRCAPLEFMGCMGDDYTFKTEEECKKTCLTAMYANRPDFCNIPRDDSKDKIRRNGCSTQFSTWSFYPDTGYCEPIPVGGCPEHKNVFYSEEHCTATCVPGLAKLEEKIEEQDQESLRIEEKIRKELEEYAAKHKHRRYI